ncbi:nucleolar pre-ribosomal-associated protein 1-like [Pseudochaenichthys georgianus]|uniref:nucleolar pre-ribosomal-associated protein 1-like n=1 Tax=Pseudochaenichthys georgianus TaxID=52239 RepID=UPI0039C338E1
MLRLRKEERLLTECTSYLSSIFVHWEPAFPLPEPQPAQPRQKVDPSQLASDTAHLLTKWSLRCLVEDSYDETRTKEFLHWIEKAVIKQGEGMQFVLLDVGMKADVLRLYHQAFEAQCSSSLSGKVDVLQLFSNIMICLLESQGNLPELHQAVVSACLPEATHDESRREAGLFLLSSYVHELWRGATSAELFLSHVSLVTSAKCNRQKASKSSLSQIRAICHDITTLKS